MNNSHDANDLTYRIIGAAIEVQTSLGGPGLLESIYEAALVHELSLQGFNVQKQLLVPVIYKGVKVRDPLCLDLLVEKQVIVEVKATERTSVIYETQLLTYLRLMGLRLGLVVNFGIKPIKDGIQRVVNG